MEEVGPLILRRGGKRMTKEQRATPYCRAARFTGEQSAGAAYSKIQNLLFHAPDCELSVYRFHMARVWHVAVVGEAPDEGLGLKLEMALACGTPFRLDSSTLKFLQHRRAEERSQATWVERHHRPGLGFRIKGVSCGKPVSFGTAGDNNELTEDSPR